MEAILFFICIGAIVGLIIIPIVTLVKVSDLQKRIKTFESSMRLHGMNLKELKRLVHENNEPPAAEIKPKEQFEETQEKTSEAIESPASTSIEKPPEPTLESQVFPVHEEQKNKDSKADIEQTTDPIDTPRPTQPITPARKTSPPTKVKTPGPLETEAKKILSSIWEWIVVGENFRKSNVSVEYAVASNWLLRIGIIFTVAGIGYFLKYSIDHGWLNETARAILSTITGILMLLGGIKLIHGKFALMGQGLMGGGIATLYFSIYASYQLYDQLIPFAPAFGLMILVTISSVLMSVKFNTQLVAILAIIGGFSTPVLLSTGSGNIPALFSYMLMLVIGVCLMTSKRRWYLLNYLSFVFTYSLATLAIRNHYQPEQFWPALSLLSGFFLVYSAMAYVYNFINNEKSNLLEIITLLVNAVVFFTLAYPLIADQYEKPWPALLPLAMSFFYFIHARSFILRKKDDRNLLISFMGLSTLALSITIPLALSEQWITVSWSAQALVILWMSLKLNSRFLKQTALILYAVVLMRFLSLDMRSQFHDRLNYDSFYDYLPLLAQHLVMFGAPILSLFAAWKLLSSPPAPSQHSIHDENDTKDWIGKHPSVIGVLCAGIALLFIFMNVEVNRIFSTFYPPLNAPSLTLVWVALSCLMYFIYRKTNRSLMQSIFCVSLISLLIKLFVFDLPIWQPFQRILIYSGPYSFLDASMRLIDFGLVIVFLVYCWKSMSPRENDKKLGHSAGTVAMILFFIWSSLELNSCLLHFLPEFQSGGLSVLWTVFALTLVFFGIIKNVRNMRLVGLAFFSLVSVKIIMFDLSRLDSLWRIVAFIALGVLILAGSFAYLSYQKKFSNSETLHE